MTLTIIAAKGERIIMGPEGPKGEIPDDKGDAGSVRAITDGKKGKRRR